MPVPVLNGNLIYALNKWRETAMQDSGTQRRAADELCGALEKWVVAVMNATPCQCCKPQEKTQSEDITIMIDDLQLVGDLTKDGS